MIQVGELSLKLSNAEKKHRKKVVKMLHHESSYNASCLQETFEQISRFANKMIGQLNSDLKEREKYFFYFSNNPGSIINFRHTE